MDVMDERIARLQSEMQPRNDEFAEVREDGRGGLEPEAKGIDALL